MIWKQRSSRGYYGKAECCLRGMLPNSLKTSSCYQVTVFSRKQEYVYRSVKHVSTPFPSLHFKKKGGGGCVFSNIYTLLGNKLNTFLRKTLNHLCSRRTKQIFIYLPNCPPPLCICTYLFPFYPLPLYFLYIPFLTPPPRPLPYPF